MKNKKLLPNGAYFYDSLYRFTQSKIQLDFQIFLQTKVINKNLKINVNMFKLKNRELPKFT